MYISELRLTNFRGFKNKKSINFKEGTNVIIGHNNAGKTSIIKSLEILFSDKTNKRLTINDFNRNITIDELKAAPPKIKLSAKLIESENDFDYSEDLVAVSTWLTKLEKPYEAQISYEFFLPKKEEDDYISAMQSITGGNIQDYWDEIEINFLQKYTYKIYGGNPDHQNVIDPDSIKKFDFQFLSAIRDVERDLFTGKNSLLKDVINFFMDYEIKTDETLEIKDIKDEINRRKRAFTDSAAPLISSLQERMDAGKKQMLKYVEETGASFDNLKPSFDGKIIDTELYSALRLIVENETGIKLPANQNGLGYNNLIYISLLLAKMQKNASGEYMGNNAKTFSILAIEEPEAHLHPNMQYKFLKFLNENQETQVRQIFITSHSPNITAAVDINNIIILYKDYNEICTAYPGMVFSESGEDIKSKNYVQRFLDVTKADIFFAKSIILVEGISEQLLVPEFAKILDYDLTDSHVSIINIGGNYFNHFLKLFDASKNENAIKKKVACITDLDPQKKEPSGKWKSCYPFALNLDDTCDYKEYSNNILNEYGSESDDFIRVYTQEKSKGYTFEYEIILNNPDNTELITESVSNKENLGEIMDCHKNGGDLDAVLGKLPETFKDRISDDIKKCSFNDQEKIKHVIAARYLKSVQKGVLAQELAYLISENHQKKLIGEENFEFNIPHYIQEAIRWICQ